jgi:PhnB protein
MSVQPIPDGYQTVTPYITVKDARAFLDFLKNAFQAEEVEVSAGEGGVIYNAEIRIGTSMVMAADARDQAVKPGTLYLYVTDPDKLYEQALAAGAKSVCPMTDQFYGDRAGGVEDAWGNQWWMAKRIKKVSPDEIARKKDETRK